MNSIINFEFFYW